MERVSRSPGVTAARLSEWRDEFLATGEAALATREKDNRDLEIDRLRAKLGEVLLAKEPLESKIDVMESGRPLGRRRSKR